MTELVLTISLFFVCNLAVSAESKISPCEGVKNKVHCLMEHYEELKTSPSLLERTYMAAENQAEKCSDPKDTAEFLEFPKKIGGSAALEEYFSKAIEKKLLVNNPKCFLKGLSNTSNESRQKVISMLKNPMFLDKMQVDKIFQKYKKNKEYSIATKEYFKK